MATKQTRDAVAIYMPIHGIGDSRDALLFCHFYHPLIAVLDVQMSNIVSLPFSLCFQLTYAFHVDSYSNGDHQYTQGHDAPKSFIYSHRCKRNQKIPIKIMIMKTLLLSFAMPRVRSTQSFIATVNTINTIRGSNIHGELLAWEPKLFLAESVNDTSSNGNRLD